MAENSFPAKEFIQSVNSLREQADQLVEARRQLIDAVAVVQRQLADEAATIRNAAKVINDPSIQAFAQEMQAEAHRAADDAFFGTNIREAWRILRGGV